MVKAYIARIKEVDPILNAVVEDRFEEALKDARTCDKQIEGKEVNAFTLASEKPLFGVPFTVKESCGLGGMCSMCNHSMHMLIHLCFFHMSK